MKTLHDPPMTTPLHPFLPPAIAAGRPLMKTLGEPSTTGSPLAVPSPTRAAGLPPIIVSGLPCITTPAGWAAATSSPQHKITERAGKNTVVRMVNLLRARLAEAMPACCGWNMAGSVLAGEDSGQFAPKLAPERLDLRHTAVPIGDLHRYRPGHGRDLEIGLRIGRNGHRVPLIARWHRDGAIRDRGIKPDTDLPDRTAIRHQMCVVEQQAVVFAERQPTAGGHLKDSALLALKHPGRIETDRERPLKAAVGVDIAHVDRGGRLIRIELDCRTWHAAARVRIERVYKGGLAKNGGLGEAPRDPRDGLREGERHRPAAVMSHERCNRTDGRRGQ